MPWCPQIWVSPLIFLPRKPTSPGYYPANRSMVVLKPQKKSPLLQLQILRQPKSTLAPFDRNGRESLDGLLDVVLVDWQRSVKPPSRGYYADKWLVDLLETKALANTRVSKFAFDIADTIRKGQRAIDEASLQLAVQIRRKLKGRNRLVFITFSLGGYIAKDVVTRKREIGCMTVAMVFISIPSSTQEKWPKVRGGILKFMPGRNHVDSASLGTKDLNSINDEFLKFQNSRNESQPIVLSISKPNPSQNIGISQLMRRATFRSTTSSDSSTEERVQAELFAVPLEPGGADAEAIKSLLVQMEEAKPISDLKNPVRYETPYIVETGNTPGEPNDDAKPFIEDRKERLGWESGYINRPAKQEDPDINHDVALAIAFYDAGDLEYSKTFFTKALKAIPETNWRSQELKFWIAKIDLKLQINSQANEAFRSLADIKSLSVLHQQTFQLDLMLEAGRWQAVGLLMEGQYKAAMEKLVEVDKNHKIAYPGRDLWSISEYILLQKDLGLAYGYLGDYNMARETVRKALEATKVRKFSKKLTYVLLDAHATSYMWLGDYQTASTQNEEALAGFKTEFGQHHLRTLESLSLRAQVLVLRGKAKDAEVLSQGAMRIMRGTFGDRHSTTLDLMLTLVASLRAQGRLAEAEYAATDVLHLSNRAHGPDHPQTLESMAELASVKIAMGDMWGAEKILQEVVRRSKDKFDPTHPSSLRYQADLANLHYQCGDFEIASQELYNVIASQRHVSSANSRFKSMKKPAVSSDNNHDIRQIISPIMTGLNDPGNPILPWLLSGLQTFAMIERDSANGDVCFAAQLLGSLYEYRRNNSSIGPDHEDTLSSALELSVTLRRLGEFSESIKLNNLVALKWSELGNDHPRYLAAKHELAMTQFNMGDWAKGEIERATVRRTRCQVLGPTHPDTLKSDLDYSTVCELMERFHEAEKIIRDVLEVLKRDHDNQVVGQKTPQLQLERHNIFGAKILRLEARLGLVLRSQGRFSEAKNILINVTTIFNQLWGANHASSLMAEHDHCLIYQAGGPQFEAEDRLERLRQKVETSFGTDCQLYLQVLATLASTLFTNGKTKDALEYQRQVLKISEKLYSSAPLRVAEHRYSLAVTLQRLKKSDEASDQIEQVLKVFKNTFGEGHDWVQAVQDEKNSWELMSMDQ